MRDPVVEHDLDAPELSVALVHLWTEGGEEWWSRNSTANAETSEEGYQRTNEE